MSDLNKLAERVEQATPEQQREMLELAFAAIFREPSRGTWTETMSIQQAIKDPVHEAAINAHSHWRRNVRDRFYGLLSWGAFTDAALMLVPEGQFVRLYSEGVQAIIVRPFSGSWLEVSRSFGVHGPAVVSAAALRAHAAKGEAE